MINFLKEANNIKEELIAIRREIHKHPELGLEEKRTSAFIKNYLTREGITFLQVATTGVCAFIKGEAKGENKTIAFRADMDALPIEDKKDVPYKSQNPGKMHACGHDGHIAILLGVAKLLNKHKQLFSGTIKLFFEPAEETVGGAKFMIEEGVLDNPSVEAVFGLHVSEATECGKISIRKGIVNAASNPFEITIKGKGGHGASPEETVDTIVVASKIVLSLQNIISREVSPFEATLITVGSIHGGTASNVIPSEVKLKGIIRTITRENRKFVIDRFTSIVQGICNTFRCEVDINIEDSYPCLYNNDHLVDLVMESAKDIIGKDNIEIKETPSLGVESFAYFAEKVPSVFFNLGTGSEKKYTREPAHSSFFDINEEALVIGVAIQCENALKYLTR